MATPKFYLDTRSVKADGTYPLKIAITRKGKTALYSVGIFLTPKQWDKKGARIVNHPNKQYLNGYIARRRIDIESFILQLKESGQLSLLTANDIKNRFIDSLNPKPIDVHTFEQGFLDFIEKKNGSTKELYKFTLKKLREYKSNFSSLVYEDITPAWLSGFDKHLNKNDTTQNYRNIHLRNIRAVFNHALDEEWTNYYPFRKFKIKAAPTRKRSMTIESLRELFNYDVLPYQEFYRDMFKLIFMLIGINTVDLHRLKEITPEGRIEFIRAKTGREYSIKVEPEALAIINKYRGVKGLLIAADRWTDHRNFRHQLNNALQCIGCTRMGRQRKKKEDGVFSGISTYWARHTWATIARKLGISKDDIKLSLGHGSKTVTDIYIDEDLEKIDAANRKVLDWVLYGKS